MPLSKEEFRKLGYQAVDIASAYLAELPDRPVFERMQESERKALMDMPLPSTALSGEEILRFVAEQVLPHPMGNGHPRFFGWVNSPPDMLAVVTEILAAAMNPSCAGGDHAAIYLEHCVIRWLMQLLGFPLEGSTGLLVSGGSAASLTALAAARHRALEQLGVDVRKQGLNGTHARLRLYASTQVHSCVQKAVELLGLGADCIRWIGVDDDLRISLEDLQAAMSEDREHGWHPFCIVANAGSVHTGVIDPINELAAIALESKTWLHVDGAYGAAAALDPDSRWLFAGLERPIPSPLIRTNGCPSRWNAGAFWCGMGRYSAMPSRWFLPTSGPRPARESGISRGFPNTASSRPGDSGLSNFGSPWRTRDHPGWRGKSRGRSAWHAIWRQKSKLLPTSNCYRMASSPSFAFATYRRS
jgi:hypothetical protein